MNISKRLVSLILIITMVFSSLGNCYATELTNEITTIGSDEVISSAAVANSLSPGDYVTLGTTTNETTNVSAENIKIGDYIQMGNYLGEEKQEYFLEFRY